MEITFSSAKLKKQFNDGRTMVKVYGPRRAKILRVVMASLRAAPNLGVFAPPYSPPHRCHELTGNLKGVLSVDLDHPYRLLICPNHGPIPMREEGGLDWSCVTYIEIKGVEDTHG